MDSKTSSITPSASPTVMIFILSLYECITCSSLVSLEETRLIAAVNWIFHVLYFLRLFMISLKYGLISSIYS